MRTPARAALVGALLVLNVTAQNSMRKIRPDPSATAARAGSAVQWRESLEAALAEAKESGRPVLWYVPTLRGSRMDRKPEIDRYMMAGPFSWPGVVDVLNAEFVPVRQAGSRADVERFDVQPIAFVEPGFLVIAPDGDVRARVDEITTLCPDWFLRRLADALPDGGANSAAFTSAATWYATLLALRATGGDGDASAQGRFVSGAVAFWSGRERDAVEIWTKLAAELPDQPWAWKAAAEAEGHGPLVNGFEVPWAPLPEAVLSAAGSRGTMAPGGVLDHGELRGAALEYFRAMQRSDGGFTDSRYDFGGTDGLPNVYVAVTSLAAWAMLEIASSSGDADARTERCLTKAFAYAMDDANLNTADSDELIWAYLYRARLCARWLELRPGDAERIRPELARAVQAIAAMQPENGAWYHEYPNPFVIGSCLVALSEAKRNGVGVPQQIVDRGVLALLKCRADDGAISYGYSERRRPRAQIAAGVGRMPLAETALADWGHGVDGALARAIDASFRYHDELAQVRKYDDHASRLGYGGFFFWYDVHARGEAIARLAPGEARDGLFAMQRDLIEALPEIDGCFVDSHELGRVYGTAMAWICLSRARG